MSDSVSTLALRVESEAAPSAISTASPTKRATSGRSRGRSRQASPGSSPVRKSRVLRTIGLSLVADAQKRKFGAVFGYASKEAQKYADELAQSFNYSTRWRKISWRRQWIFFASPASRRRFAEIRVRSEQASGGLGGVYQLRGGLGANDAGADRRDARETEMAKTLGVLVYDAYVKEKMAQEARQGLKFATEAAAKTHARYSVIMEQSASATGQVAREADNYSSRLRVLRARSEDLRGSLGEALIEPATQLVSAATLAIEKLNALDSTTRNFLVVGGLAAAGLASLGAAVAPLVGGLAQLVAAKKLATLAARETAASSCVETGALGNGNGGADGVYGDRRDGDDSPGRGDSCDERGNGGGRGGDACARSGNFGAGSAYACDRSGNGGARTKRGGASGGAKRGNATV